MSFQSEEQWQAVDYCVDCGDTLYQMGDNYRWGSTYCPYSENGHTTENELDLEVFDGENEI